jgi:hypothetical protein
MSTSSDDIRIATYHIRDPVRDLATTVAEIQATGIEVAFFPALERGPDRPDGDEAGALCRMLTRGDASWRAIFTPEPLGHGHDARGPALLASVPMRLVAPPEDSRLHVEILPVGGSALQLLASATAIPEPLRARFIGPNRAYLLEPGADHLSVPRTG